MNSKGRIYVPLSVRETAGINENDVVQIMGRGGVILINKANVSANDPIELIQNEISQEKVLAEQEKDKIKSQIKQMLKEGHSLDDVLEEVLLFLF
jgi:bifunctional DNA-binding transcriptional regulator/antitoxin component of YhaV-PrlF toxin-antitoxin module